MAETIALTINTEILKKFDSVVDYGKRSSTISKLMENYAATQNKDVDGINLELLNIEVDELQKQKTKIDGELSLKLDLKDKIYEKQLESRKKELETQENLIKTSKSCIECGDLAGNDAKKFPKGLVCIQCMGNRKPGYLQKWSE